MCVVATVQALRALRLAGLHEEANRILGVPPTKALYYS